MKKIVTLALVFLVIQTQEAHAQTPAQVTIQDDAKVGLIVTGTGNTINTTQIFGKSPEYAELKKRLDGLAAAIIKKVEQCEKFKQKNYDQVDQDGCRAELIALNAERDSVQKIETRFRDDVIRLAESFSKMELNSERLRLAKALFDEGKIREADHVLNAREMKQEGDALLAEKAREQEKLQRTNSLLRIKADEFALKARLKATDYGDLLRYDSAEMYFAQSFRYAEDVDNLWAFGELLYYQNQSQRGIGYFEKALKLARSENEEATFAMNLGLLYLKIQEMEDAEKMLLRSLGIRERLAKANPTLFEPDLAVIESNYGEFLRVNDRVGDAETMYHRSLEIAERLAKVNPAKFEPDLAMTVMNMGNFYYALKKIGDAEKMYRRSLDIYERLSKGNLRQFDRGLAGTAMNLGSLYITVQKMKDSETMYCRSLEILERLVKADPAQFEPDLAMTTMNLGMLYGTIQKRAEAETMYARSLDIYERLAITNPAQFEPDLASLLNNFGFFKQVSGQWKEAKKMVSRALALRQKAVASGQTYIWPELGRVYNNMAALRDSFELKKDHASASAIQRERAECMYTLKSISIDFKLEASTAYNYLYLLCYYAHDYRQAAEAAEKVLELSPARNWVRPNLGHSYLLANDWPKAKSVYEEYLKNEADPTKAKKTLGKEWDELEAAGIPCKEMEKARAWAKE